MEKKDFAIIEIGSNNTKTHIYKNNNLIYDNTSTIEFKKNYGNFKKICNEDLEKLYKVIEKAKTYTSNIYIFGCSIFRKITKNELNEINQLLKNKFNLIINVVSQTDEASLTAYGCYNDISYNGNICVFIGGGGSTELLFIKNKEIIEKKYFDFGVVDITKKFPSLKEDFNTCTFDEVSSYVSPLIGDLDIKCDILILAGGDHLYWYNNAKYKLEENTLYKSTNQPYMITIETSDKYDKNALERSLNEVRENSDNPLWFDGSRAMKVITNTISHKISAKYIIPTKINMEDGLAKQIMNGNFDK